MLFRITVRQAQHTTVVTPRGELDIVTAPELEAVLSAQRGPVLLDLTKLTFVDLTGLRLILERYARSQADGSLLDLKVGEVVRRLAALMEVDDRLPDAGEPEPAA